MLGTVALSGAPSGPIGPVRRRVTATATTAATNPVISDGRFSANASIAYPAHAAKNQSVPKAMFRMRGVSGGGLVVR